MFKAIPNFPLYAIPLTEITAAANTFGMSTEFDDDASSDDDDRTVQTKLQTLKMKKK